MKSTKRTLMKECIAKAVTLSLSKGLCLFGLLLGFSAIASAADLAKIEYLCCAWGPAMTLPSKAGEKAQFDDSQEEVYFLKQVTGHGVGIYLCKMKADGNEKTEIKELWQDPNYPIDTQDCTTWMDVCVRTHQVAVTVSFAGSDIMGLWTMNLDGSNLRRIISPVLTAKGLQSVGGVSWTPDGQRIVYGEAIRGAGRNGRIAKCDKNGESRVYLTDGPVDNSPRVSPDGKEVAFVHWITKGNVHDSWLWLVDVNGSNSHPLPNPDAKPNWSAPAHWGLFPAWSPDGKEIFIMGVDSELIDVGTGRMVLDRRPALQGKRDGTCGWPHWGKQGFVGFSVGGILFTDSELREAKWIGSSKMVECSGENESCRW
jgi:hypothetical protein